MTGGCLVQYIENNLVFCQPDGRYYSPDRLGARVVELMRKVGLHGVSLHSLRHSHASYSPKQGSSPGRDVGAARSMLIKT